MRHEPCIVESYGSWMSKLGSKAFNTTWMESTVRINLKCMYVKCKSLKRLYYFRIALILYLSIGGWLCPRVATVTDEVIKTVCWLLRDTWEWVGTVLCEVTENLPGSPEVFWPLDQHGSRSETLFESVLSNSLLNHMPNINSLNYLKKICHMGSAECTLNVSIKWLNWNIASRSNWMLTSCTPRILKWSLNSGHQQGFNDKESIEFMRRSYAPFSDCHHLILRSGWKVVMMFSMRWLLGLRWRL